MGLGRAPRSGPGRWALEQRVEDERLLGDDVAALAPGARLGRRSRDDARETVVVVLVVVRGRVLALDAARLRQRGDLGLDRGRALDRRRLLGPGAALRLATLLVPLLLRRNRRRIGRRLERAAPAAGREREDEEARREKGAAADANGQDHRGPRT